MADTERACFSREQLFEFLKLDNVKTVSSDAVQKAQIGDPVELYNIGREYEVSRQEFTKALGFYFLSADLNYGQASEAIGVMYQKGHGVPVHYHVALEWYLKAARNGSPQYGLLIGTMFLKGLGINTDVVKAHEWFHKQGLTLSGDEFRIFLTKEQKDKSIDRLISETEEILHQAVFRTITFDAYKQMKIAEINLVNHIKMLQKSNSMCIKMNQDLSGQVESLVKDNNKLKSALTSNSATAKKEKKALEKSNSNYKQDLEQALQRVSELQSDNAQLFNMIATEKLAKGANEKTSQQQETAIEIGKEKLEQERIQLNQELEKERLQLKNEVEQERTKHKDELEQQKIKHKEELDKERANHKKAMDHVKEQNKATMDALRSTNKKNMEREREIREKQVERYKDLLKKETEREKTQAQKLKSAHTQHKATEQQLHQQVSDLQAQIKELEQKVKNQQTENVEIKERQGDNQDTLLLLSQSYSSFEQEMGNMDALIRFMQSTRNNLNRSSLEMKAAIAGAGGRVGKAAGYRSILSHSALHVQQELERESEMRRKRRREEVNSD